MYFVSGSNHAGEIRGLALSGCALGVAVTELNEEAMAELEWLAGGPTKVFADTGAFSEVGFPAGVPTIVDLITPAEWDRRLALLERMAQILGKQLWVVAPDCVAHQEETLRRLVTYRDRVLAIRALGAHIIVPVQKGRMTMTEFRAEAERILGDKDVTWGIPMKKDATTVDELREFATYLFEETCPTTIHLLGLGPKSKVYERAVLTVMMESPATKVSCDSVRITALVGRTNGKNGGPRPLTAARDALLAQGVTGTANLKAGAIVQVFHAELRKEVQAMRRAGWFDPELESAPGVPLEEGCISYGPGGPFGEEVAS